MSGQDVAVGTGQAQSTEARGTVVDRLRDLADEMEGATTTEGVQLVPVVARDVRVGAVMTESFGERLTVSEIVVVDSMVRSDGTTPLLKFKGRVTTQTEPNGFESSNTLWADQYAVVER